MSNKLNQITIAGFKSLEQATVELGDLNILIGSNGSGKSNFVGVFKLLRQIVERRLQIAVRENGGAEKLLHYGSKQTEALRISLNFYPNYYKIDLKPSNDDSLFIEKEETGFRADNYPRPFWDRIAEGSIESNLGGSAKKGGVPKHVFNTLKDWRVYHFHDTSNSAGVKKTAQLNDNLYLREDAANLAAFLYRMQQEDRKHFDRIEKTIPSVVPMFREFLLRPDPLNPETIRLEWLSKDSDFIFGASELSDGSLRFICLCVLLLQPERPSLILLDEPELGLHPAAIQILGGLLRKAANFSQLIVSTQSAELVSCFEAEDVLVVEFRDGASVFERQDEEGLANWLSHYSLGELWNKNIIGGRP